MSEQPDSGLEVSVDLADLVKVLTHRNGELSQQVAMLEAAVMKLRREAEPVNGQPVEVSNAPPR
jgi:hypothetical protein